MSETINIDSSRYGIVEKFQDFILPFCWRVIYIFNPNYMCGMTYGHDDIFLKFLVDFGTLKTIDWVLFDDCAKVFVISVF